MPLIGHNIGTNKPKYFKFLLQAEGLLPKDPSPFPQNATPLLVARESCMYTPSLIPSSLAPPPLATTMMPERCCRRRHGQSPPAAPRSGAMTSPCYGQTAGRTTTHTPGSVRRAMTARRRARMTAAATGGVRSYNKASYDGGRCYCCRSGSSAAWRLRSGCGCRRSCAAGAFAWLIWGEGCVALLTIQLSSGSPSQTLICRVR